MAVRYAPDSRGQTDGTRASLIAQARGARATKDIAGLPLFGFRAATPVCGSTLHGGMSRIFAKSGARLGGSGAKCKPVLQNGLEFDQMRSHRSPPGENQETRPSNQLDAISSSQNPANNSADNQWEMQRARQ